MIYTYCKCYIFLLFVSHVYFLTNILRFVLAAIVGYLIYDWGENEHNRLTRKDPKEFENDV